MKYKTYLRRSKSRGKGRKSGWSRGVSGKQRQALPAFTSCGRAPGMEEPGQEKCIAQLLSHQRTRGDPGEVSPLTCSTSLEEAGSIAAMSPRRASQLHLGQHYLFQTPLVVLLLLPHLSLAHELLGSTNRQTSSSETLLCPKHNFLVPRKKEAI